MDCYIALRAFPAISAKDYDPYANRRTSSWTPDVAHFLMDVERVTEEALGENIALQAAWFAMAAGEGASVPAKIRNDVYRLCGTLYKSRGLSPSRYFRRSLKNDGWMTADGDA